MARAYGVVVGPDGANAPMADPLALGAASEQHLPACITGEIDGPSHSPALRQPSPTASDGAFTAGTILYVSPTAADIDLYGGIGAGSRQLLGTYCELHQDVEGSS